MALLLQGQVLRTLMVFHGRRRMTTLQDIDGTLRQDIVRAADQRVVALGLVGVVGVAVGAVCELQIICGWE